MNAAGDRSGQRHALGRGGRVQREVIDVPETRFERDDLAKVIGVRKQRLGRLERESIEARNAWRDARDGLRAAKQAWRKALQDAQDFWKQARTAFLSMTTTSGQFRKAKAVYERMKSDAAGQRLKCKESVAACKDKRRMFFEARKRVMEAKRQQEKLVMMRDEIRLSRQKEEW